MDLQVHRVAPMGAAMGQAPPKSQNGPLGVPKPRLTAMTAAELQCMTFDPIRYVAEPYVAEGLTLFAGKPKLGKSWLVLDICNSVARGTYTLGGAHCQEGDVLYAALEDNPRRLRERMDKVCLFPEWPERLTFWTEMPRLEDGGIDALRDWITTQPNPRLIVIDVLNKVRASKGRNEDSYVYDYRSVAPLKALADEFSLAIILVHHTRKMGADDKLETVSGTNGLTGAADTILVLDRSGEGCTLYARGRDIAEIDTAVQFEKDTCRWRVLGEASAVRRSSARNKIVEMLRNASGPMTSKEMADVTDQTDNAVRRLLPKMVKDGDVIRTERGKYASPDINLGNNGNEGNTSGAAVAVCAPVTDVTAPAEAPDNVGVSQRISENPGGLHG